MKVEGLTEAFERLQKASVIAGAQVSNLGGAVRAMVAGTGVCSLEEALRAAFMVEVIFPEPLPPWSIDVKSWNELIQEECQDFVPPKVRHLAVHHPKRRVRNKNWNRMWKIHERCLKCHK